MFWYLNSWGWIPSPTLEGPSPTLQGIRKKNFYFFSVRPKLMKEKNCYNFFSIISSFFAKIFLKTLPKKNFSWKILSNRRVFRDPRETLMKTIFAKDFFTDSPKLMMKGKFFFRIPCIIRRYMFVRCAGRGNLMIKGRIL